MSAQTYKIEYPNICSDKLFEGFIGAVMGRIDETVAVLVDALGIPTCFRWREKDYFVGNGASRWFSRSEWWVGERAQKGIGSGVLEVEMWRLRDVDGGVFDLLHNSVTGAWKLIRKFE